MEKMICMPKIAEDPFAKFFPKKKDEAEKFEENQKKVESMWRDVLNMPGLKSILIDEKSGKSFRWTQKNGVWEAVSLDEGMKPQPLKIPATQSVETRLSWFSIGFQPTAILTIQE